MSRIIRQGYGAMHNKEHWEGFYQQQTGSESSWYQDYPQLSLLFIESAGVTVDQPILDVGGGTSLLVDNLLLKGYEKLAVLDISESAIAHSRRRLGLRADHVEWHVADVRSFEPPYRFTLWHDRAVFHFLTEEADRQAYLNVLKTALKPDGHVVLATFAPHGPDQCGGLPVMRYDADMLEALLGDEYKLIESWPEEHITPTGEVQPFIYSLFSLQG
jgi:SAM-dependent methyltransferase